MERIEFLRTILPDGGYYAAAGITGDKIAQTFHPSIEALDARLEELRAAGKNVFYGVASYSTDSNRTSNNVKELKSFFLDLDCGAGDDKKYPDQKSALLALRELVRDLRLPTPTIVSSGRGVHAYWILDQAVPRSHWAPVAEKLKQFCGMKSFKADPAVTADAARIMRAPGTQHVKDPQNPLNVEVLKVGEVVAFDAFRTLLGVSEADLAAWGTPKPQMDDVTKRLLSNTKTEFREILKKCVAGEGCAQIMYAVANQETTSEPLWRGVLSIANVCTDREKAIHKVSSQHPGYNPDVALQKAAGTKGPYTCTSFQNIDSSLCEGCKHWGKIKSPVVLGHSGVLAADEEDNRIEETITDKMGVAETKTYEIPPFPYPFFRGKNGGVYVKETRESKDGTSVSEDKLIYPYDLYVVSLIDDPHDGMCALMRVHFPLDGMKEFCVPVKDLLAKDRFRDTVGSKGICVSNSKLDEIMAYTNHFVNQQQKKEKSKLGRVQFGWVDDYTAFVVGDREIRANEIVYSPPSATTVGIVPRFRQAGTLDEWKKITDFYRQPGQELPLFALLAGFASPLMPFTGTQGGIISLYSNRGGTGKTTTLWMINSIFGHPREAMLIQDDTLLSRFSRMGVMNHIAPTTDEITNETPETLSKQIYAALQGRGRNRMHSGINRERENTTTWNSISIVTGNSTVSDKLLALKARPDGELRRIMEFEFPVPSEELAKATTDSVFRPLFYNYGIAGDVYIQYLLNNTSRIRGLLEDMQNRVDAAAGLTQREQYWSGTASAILTAGVLARDAGVIDLTDEDLVRIYDWVVARLRDMRSTVVTSFTDPEEIMAGFINEHINNILIINSQIDRRAGIAVAPIREPKNALILRYEPDTQLLMASVKHFRAYCAKHQVSYANILNGLKAADKLVGVARKRLGKGTAISANEFVVVMKNMDESLVDTQGDADADKPRDNGQG